MTSISTVPKPKLALKVALVKAGWEIIQNGYLNPGWKKTKMAHQTMKQDKIV